MSAERPVVVCVDDDPLLLEDLQDTLDEHYQVRTFENPKEALSHLAEADSVSVLLSDMRMPEMSGAELLAGAKSVVPDATRVLLTGFTDIDSALKAVNQGAVYRMLLKPCSNEDLLRNVAEAHEQHRLVVAEKELLQRTLRESIHALADTLAIANPLAYGRVSQTQRLVSDVGHRLELAETWQLDVAAVMYHLGHISMSDEALSALHRGLELGPQHEEQLSQGQGLALMLVSRIPRLEFAARALQAVAEPDKAVEDRVALIFRTTIHFQQLHARGVAPDRILSMLRSRRVSYDRAALDALSSLCASDRPSTPMVDLRSSQLSEGMVLMEDLRNADGALLVARGQVVTDTLRRRLLHNMNSSETMSVAATRAGKRKR